MKTLHKRFILRVPKNVKLFLCTKRKIILIKNKNKICLVNLKIEVLVEKEKIVITSNSNIFKSNRNKNGLKTIQGTTLSLIEQTFLEVLSLRFKKKLVTVGTGYKIFSLENLKGENLLHFKLGYSHQIYFKSINKTKAVCLKPTKILLFSNFYQCLTQTVSFVKSFRLPDPYKGKGIKFFNESIKLKEGKKITR